MNILKANRAINPSKINLSAEMLHFYFRAYSRPRHGLRPRSAQSPPEGGKGAGPPPRCRASRCAGPRTRVEPAPLPPRSWAWGRKGLLRSPFPLGNDTRVSRRGETTFPTAGRGNAPFRALLLGGAWGPPNPTALQPRAPAPPPPQPAGLRSLLFDGRAGSNGGCPTRGAGGGGFRQSPGSRIQRVHPWEAREDEEGGEPRPEPRGEPAAGISAIPHPASARALHRLQGTNVVFI